MENTSLKSTEGDGIMRGQVSRWFALAGDYSRHVQRLRSSRTIQTALGIPVGEDEVKRLAGVPLPAELSRLTIDLTGEAVRYGLDATPLALFRYRGYGALTEAAIVVELIGHRAIAKPAQNQGPPEPDAAFEAPPGNGPFPPSKFYFNGKSVHLELTPWRLLAFVWQQPHYVANAREAIKQAWKPPLRTPHGPQSNAVKTAIKKINRALSAAEYPKSFRQRDQHFSIE